MLLKVLNIFSLFLLFGLCEADIESEYYIENIREDYCVDYCANQCKGDIFNVKTKTCTKTGNTIVTDLYEIQFYFSAIILTWKTQLIDLKQIKNLETSNNRIIVRKLIILFNKTVFENNFVQSIRYMKAFNFFKVEFISKTNIFEYEVFVSSGPQRALLSCPNGIVNPSTIWHNFLAKKMDKLEEITFRCKGSFLIRNNTFQNTIHLKIISFYDVNLENLNEITFKNLRNIKELKFYRCIFQGQSFLRSTVLQSNLEVVLFVNVGRINLTNLENYKKLQIIIVDQGVQSYYSQEPNKQTAFLCIPWLLMSPKICHFNIGTNGKRCPSKCSCFLQYSDKRFIINCYMQGLSNIPDLPIPIIGYTSLNFSGNELKRLPDKSSVGYNNLRELHLANNKLTELNIDQLPQNITFLDIRNNNIKSLDPKVAEFLMKRENPTSLLQTGIYWKSNCDNKHLLRYLDLLRNRKIIVNIDEEIDNAVYYHHLQGPCPDSCTCCSNGDTQFIINCTSAALRTFPKLPNYIIGYSILLLDNNLIEALPISSMHNSTLREIHMKNNSMTHLHLDQLPSNIRVLDIRQNKLTALDDKVTQTISNLRIIELSGNPWQCNCKFTKFLEYLRRNNSIEYKAALGNCSGQEECPNQCTCCKDDNLRFIVNCIRKNLSKIPPIPITENATLLFGHNRLNLLNRSITGFDQLKELHLDNNGITELDFVPHNIEFLDIRNNSLWKLSDNLIDFLIQKSKINNLALYISGNKWSCQCEDINFFRFTKSFAENVKDLCSTQCSDSILFVSLEEEDICPPEIPSYFVIFTSFILFTIILSILQCFWESIRMWMYEKNLFIRFTARLEVDTDTKYDCFLAYCHKDSHLVNEYVDRLEHGRRKLRLCFYERDWLAGEPIPDCICYSVENSKCTAIIMTNHFLKSVWGRLEFRLALHATSKDPHKRLIVIVYPGVENFDELDGELQNYLKLNTYLMRSDRNFWNKLIYALPHKKIDENQEVELAEVGPGNS